MPNDAIVRDVIVGSPLARLLGLVVDAVADDHVRLRLPYREAVTTVGDTVHGGAIAALIDTAATAAAWAGADLAVQQRGTTIGLSVNYLAAGRAQDLTATARVLQRGRRICVLDVEVTAADATAVARALVTYKVG
jgi:uncharacterized protein (TIGR00369 family)